MARGTLRLIHKKDCPAKGADARRCRCGPRVQARLAGRDYTVGYLGKGWLMADLEPFDRKLVDMRELMLEGRNPRPQRAVLLSEWAISFFQNLHAAATTGAISPLTFNTYEGDWRRHIGPFFGRYPLGAIDVPLVNRYISAKLAAGLSRTTVMNSLTVLSALLTDAAAESPPLIPANPLRSPRRGRHGNRRLGIQLEAERRPPKHLEIDAAIALLEATPLEHFDLVLCPLVTGFRRNEVFGLEWPQLNWGQNLVSLEHQLRKGQKVRCKYGSERVVPLYSGLAAALGRRRQADGWIFANPDGGPWSETRAREILDEAYAAAGLKEIIEKHSQREDGGQGRRRGHKGEGLGWHALRHTYNSVLAAGGVPRHVREELLGHKRRDITSRYEHMLSGAFQQVDDVLEQAFGDVVRRRLGHDWRTGEPTTSKRHGVHVASTFAGEPMGTHESPSEEGFRAFRL